MSQKYTVLHLDDNPVFIDITKELFNKRDDILYESAFSEQDAFGFMKKKQPDLLFVDLMLEDYGNTVPGEQFIERVKELYPQTRMLVLSGYPEPEIMKEKLAHKIIHYEEKGGDPEKFVTNVVQFLSE